MLTLQLHTHGYLLTTNSHPPQLPPPMKKKKNFSRVATPHQRHFRISYVINLDLSQKGHHAAHRTAGRRVLSCSLWSKNYLRPVDFDSCLSFRHLYNNRHLPLFNTDIDELMFNMVDLSPIKLSAVIWYWPAQSFASAPVIIESHYDDKTENWENKDWRKKERKKKDETKYFLFVQVRSFCGMFVLFICLQELLP